MIKHKREIWPHLIETVKTRREAQMQRWRELGAKVGVREWDIKEGDKLATDAKSVEA